MRFTLTETQQRQTAGNRGPTDVAQAEARLSLAEAQLETARARLIESRESYIRLVGHAPENLQAPPPLPVMPDSATTAVTIALENNPELLAARTELAAARFDVDAAGAERLPRLSAVGGVNQYDYLGSLATNTGPRNGDQGTTAFVGLRLDVPIFQGGRDAALVRQAQAQMSVATEQVVGAERDVVASTRSAFANWRSAEVVVGASERGVAANERVLEGLRAETRAGFRPLLDRLNAEQELLNAQVTLVTARRDAYVAGFELLAAMGQAEARDLDLEGLTLYDPAVYYAQNRNRVFQIGRDLEPVVVGSATVETAVQTAEVLPFEGPTVPQLAENSGAR
jgi:outer membrane protein